MPANTTPLRIQEQLKKETLYGCALCGCPIVEYVHITPHPDIQAFLPENMVALCPSHRIKYENRQITEAVLHDAKINPYNKINEASFVIGESQEMIVNIGNRKFINTSRILVIDDFDIISIRRGGGEEQQDRYKKYILLDINFFDKFNNLIAIVSENGWTAERRKSISSGDWSIIYEPKHLVIQNPSRNILFDVKISNNEIALTANGMYYNRSLIRITENEIFLDDLEIAVDQKGTVLKNYEAGIVAET
jgi:hypothetical protein